MKEQTTGEKYRNKKGKNEKRKCWNRNETATDTEGTTHL
jgi:hypothetical protein